MRTGLLLLLTTGTYSVLAYPDVPLADQEKQFKAYDGAGDEIQLWTSAGGTKRRSLKPQPAAAEKTSAPPKKQRKAKAK